MCTLAPAAEGAEARSTTACGALRLCWEMPVDPQGCWCGLGCARGLVMPVLPPCCEYLKTARVQGQGAQEHRLPGYKFATASVLLIPEAPLISLDLSFLLLWWG